MVDHGSLEQRIEQALTGLEVDFVVHGPGEFLLTLPGERRHRTLVWLIVGLRDLAVESFVCRRPDENEADVFRYLLQRNAKLRSVSYSLDASGDIHLVGRIGVPGLAALDPGALSAELDTLLGVVLSASDEDFNQILERGFASAIRREWAWRSSTGQSVQNLQAFRHLIDTQP